MENAKPMSTSVNLEYNPFLQAVLTQSPLLYQVRVVGEIPKQKTKRRT